MIQPLHEYVLLEKLPQEKKVGSIVLTKQEKVANVATVVAVGSGSKDKDGKVTPIELKVGERVVYREYSGTEYKEGDHQYLLIKEEDIIAIVRD